MVDEAQNDVNNELNNLPANQAGTITGSVPTDEVEAQAIMGANGPTMEKTMTEEFNNVDGSHSDDATVADAIIDAANKDNIDVTGKVGAKMYQKVLDGLDDKRAAWLRGSLPNYRAESKYITSGVTGNYEKELENAPTMAVVNGKLSPRIVAGSIIDEAEKDETSPDCTGSVDKDGKHGVGRGTPPCQEIVAFKKQTNNANLQNNPTPLTDNAGSDGGSGSGSGSGA
ncbi:hypothetical protein GUITHDRAFT_109962 [Guillardia theta CCMP2712]|uniref:Uncharacterized protein n=1 Tax=Guillardia theta (strain CCMP2712) TaxID=905079 RepID=L1J6L0_GUITC|nr:hypothetical protein GUITHDRAFT_109962 [Guillardia theta CCMP2712]EKX44178.1 hypothetical protein GUITHDRAFT_109962 [Guillardia theta CCMP2712]|eukprot:XP_005831158.1 hypothetical protein GUITHDRAFT_109962 [Guillardia theta CCMP2712]